MDIPGSKSPNSALSFRYNANNEELEELYNVCEDDPPTPLADASPTVHSEGASPKRTDKTSSIIDKYFKSMRVEKGEKLDEQKSESSKGSEEHSRNSTPVKEVTSSPVKDYLNRLSKRSNATSTSEAAPEVKEGSNETWKIFRDFKYKLAQTVEDMKSRSAEDTKEKSVQRDNSTSDSEENSAVKDLDQSVGDTDNQVSSLASSIQNLSDMTQPITAKANDFDTSLPRERNNSESTDDTHKNLDPNDTTDIPKDVFDDNALLDVESGVEVLEDTNMDMLTGGDVLDCDNPLKPNPERTDLLPPYVVYTDHSCQPPSKNNRLKPEDKPVKPKASLFTFFIYFLVFLILASYAIFPNANTWNGFLYGLLFFSFMGNMKQWVMDHYFKESEEPGFFQVKKSTDIPSMYTIPSVKEYKPIKKYEGWINHYRFPDYDPISYHINKTTTAFMKLEGCNLRISYTKTKVAKRALWDEKIDKVLFYQHRLYNLTGARLLLLPKGLVTRRQWSKKYPLCVVLGENESIKVLEKESSNERRPSEQGSPEKKREPLPTEVESTETNTSPEKKKKFVWRRREKSVSHEEGTREGLRHRLVRKMHRDKKVDSVATATDGAEGNFLMKESLEEPSFFDAEMELTTRSVTSTREEEEELDETEISKIKDFLEEADTEAGTEGASEGEWSVHVRSTHSARLYLFARTGRDKHEWFRRLDTAISEANAASAESSSEERPASEPSSEKEKDLRDMAVYKVSEKDTVSFAKPLLNKSLEALADQTQYNIKPPLLHHSDIEGYEKLFWPFLFKIIQSKSPSPSCDCRLLPPEVTWVNTVMARVLYDIMSDAKLVSRVQDRIQRKLNTLKLPSFMSPLIITELSLAGACPLISRVVPPTWDERGVWLDAELRYDGGAFISILTQINLLKLKEKNASPEEQLLAAETIVEHEMAASAPGFVCNEKQLRERKPAIYDSEVEDSAESSSDDEAPVMQPVDSTECVTADSQTSVAAPDSASSKKKFLRMVDKIATNKYFQQVTDYKYIKRAMEGLSNTDIKLQLEVHGLEGRLALNLPPPPHDRLWVGFRTNPQLILKARPAFGARTLRFTHITNWIEQKLTKEFEKFLVLPNMEDFVVDLMTPTPVLCE